MKATEIRVGNWVKEESLGYKQWGLKDFDNYHGEHYPENWISDKIEPIPLTPEILEKAGFEKSDFRTDILYNRLHIECADDGRFYYYIHIDGDDYYDWRALEIKHLHQLQNLYFALAGEELDINL